MLRPALLLSALVLALAAAPAAADDASVFDAYNAGHAPTAAASDAYVRASKRAQRADSRREWRRALRSVIRADRRINEALGVIEAAVEAESASSEAGTSARDHALAEVRGWARANRLEIRAIRHVLAGRERRAGRLLRRATKIMYRTYDHGRDAVREFEAAGLTHPDGAVSLGDD